MEIKPLALDPKTEKHRDVIELFNSMMIRSLGVPKRYFDINKRYPDLDSLGDDCKALVLAIVKAHSALETNPVTGHLTAWVVLDEALKGVADARRDC